MFTLTSFVNIIERMAHEQFNQRTNIFQYGKINRVNGVRYFF